MTVKIHPIVFQKSSAQNCLNRKIEKHFVENDLHAIKEEQINQVFELPDEEEDVTERNTDVTHECGVEQNDDTPLLSNGNRRSSHTREKDNRGNDETDEHSFANEDERNKNHMCRVGEVEQNSELELFKTDKSRVGQDSKDLETTTFIRDRSLRKSQTKRRNTIHGSLEHDSNTDSSSAENKRSKQSYFLCFTKPRQTRRTDKTTKLIEALNNLKRSTFSENDFSVITADMSSHRSDLIENDELPVVEKQRREAIWELYKKECSFFSGCLLVLKHCFMEPLKRLQLEDHLQFVNPDEIFCHLDDLCDVSHEFCKELMTVLQNKIKSEDVWPTSSLIEVLNKFFKLSSDKNVYHTYCIHDFKRKANVKRLRENENFVEFEKWCSKDDRCNRLQLDDLLMAPMQHCTRLRLLLENIQKYTSLDSDKNRLASAIKSVHKSLLHLEKKIKCTEKTERVWELQQQIEWLTVTEVDPHTYIPECLRSNISSQVCSSLFARGHRCLLHDGLVLLIQNNSKPISVYLFLFDDMVLLTRPKGDKKKSTQPKYVVYRQPIELNFLRIHDVDTNDTSGCDIVYA
uniref:Pleckstrin homology domain-containing family G member 6-like isoform X2 n=1 Tax=Crassostrea virginica TaxID=6565 RepID=A0A8B8A8F9_CRAVI|nr:pleckstrin homology domain-containing family G member 6-like isoform X2 [Crassostrea virginica]